jgi:hypothetical protein
MVHTESNVLLQKNPVNYAVIAKPVDSPEFQIDCPFLELLT